MTADTRTTDDARETVPATSNTAGRQDNSQEPGVSREGWSAARWAYAFYAVAATGAVIGQTWVALDHLPWPSQVPVVVRVLAVLPFALCLELLAMALAAMADERMRLGERAYGFRIFSMMVAVVAVGIQVLGHWPQLYWSSVFGVLSASAYALWLLHSAARRRDALRAAGKLADTAPHYGLWRRVRHPIWTARAAELAREGSVDATTGAWRPLGLFESLRAAELAMADERRRPAVALAVEKVVRADNSDWRMADIAVHALDLDRLATELAARVNYGAWADRLAPAITAPILGPAECDAHSPAMLNHKTSETAPAQLHDTPARADTETDTDAASTDLDPQRHHQPGPEPHDDGRDRPDEDPDDDYGDEDYGDDDRDEGDDSGEDYDDGVELAPDLVPLLPAARTACEELIREGRTVSRDALAHRLRRNGYAIRNNRVSELLNALRREEASLNGARPTVPA